MQLQMLMQVLFQAELAEPETYEVTGLFCIAESFLAGGASMALAVVFDHFTGGRNEFQFPADIFLADQDHLRTTYRTDLILFRKWDHYFFNFQAFEEFLMCCLLFTGMLPDYRFAFQQGWILFHFCFIKEILLSRNIIRSSLAGGTKEFFLSDNLPVPEELSHDWFFRQ